MSDAPLTAAELAELAKIDTPTICNALEITSPERRADGFTEHVPVTKDVL